MKTLIRDVSVSRNGLKEKLKNDLNRFAEETTFSQNGKSPDFISRFLSWAFIWGLGFMVEPFLNMVNLNYHYSLVGCSILMVRDIVFGLIAFFTWRAFFGHRKPKKYERYNNKYLGAILFATSIFTLGYYSIVFNGAYPIHSLKQAFILFYPAKLLTYVFFQQMTNTLLLLDTSIDRLGYRDGLFFTAFLFGLTHFGCMAVNVPSPIVLLLSLLSAFAMYYWGMLRKKYNTLSYSLVIHYIFWITIQAVSMGVY